MQPVTAGKIVHRPDLFDTPQDDDHGWVVPVDIHHPRGSGRLFMRSHDEWSRFKELAEQQGGVHDFAWWTARGFRGEQD